MSYLSICGDLDLDTIDVRYKGKSSKIKNNPRNWEKSLERIQSESLGSIGFYCKSKLRDIDKKEITIFYNNLNDKQLFKNNRIDIGIPIDTRESIEYGSLDLLFKELIDIFRADYGYVNLYLASTDIRVEAKVFSENINYWPIDCLNHKKHLGYKDKVQDINWLNYFSERIVSLIGACPEKLCVEKDDISHGVYLKVAESPLFSERDKARIAKLREWAKDVIAPPDWHERYLSYYEEDFKS